MLQLARDLLVPCPVSMCGVNESQLSWQKLGNSARTFVHCSCFCYSTEGSVWLSCHAISTMHAITGCSNEHKSVSGAVCCPFLIHSLPIQPLYRPTPATLVPTTGCGVVSISECSEARGDHSLFNPRRYECV